MIERLPALGTSWYERGVSYWAWRAGTTLLLLAGVAIYVAIISGVVHAAGSPGSPGFLAVLTAEAVFSLGTAALLIRRSLHGRSLIRLPGLAQPLGEIAVGGEGVGMVGAERSQVVGEQVAILGDGPAGLPGPTQPSGQVAAGDKGAGVVGAQNPQVVGEQVTGLGELPGLAQPVGQVGEGVRVVGPRSSCAMSRARSNSGRAVSNWPKLLSTRPRGTHDGHATLTGRPLRHGQDARQPRWHWTARKAPPWTAELPAEPGFSLTRCWFRASCRRDPRS